MCLLSPSRLALYGSNCCSVSAHSLPLKPNIENIHTVKNLTLLLTLLAYGQLCMGQVAPSPQPTPTPSESRNTLQHWQALAIQKYPALAKQDSELNKRFVEIVAERRKTTPSFFQNPKWPILLADELSKIRELVTASGKKYENFTVSRIEPDGITISTDSETLKIPWVLALIKREKAEIFQ